jgi:hypothetical protein
MIVWNFLELTVFQTILLLREHQQRIKNMTAFQKTTKENTKEWRTARKIIDLLKKKFASMIFSKIKGFLMIAWSITPFPWHAGFLFFAGKIALI